VYREAVDERLGVRVFKRKSDFDPVEIIINTNWETALHRHLYTLQNPLSLLGLEFFTVGYTHGGGTTTVRLQQLKRIKNN
jgi:hypothetical protein